MKKFLYCFFTILFLTPMFFVSINAYFFSENTDGVVYQGFGDAIHINNGETMDFKTFEMNYCEFFFEEDTVITVDFTLYGKRARIDFFTIDWILPCYTKLMAVEVPAQKIETTRGIIQEGFYFTILSDNDGIAKGNITFNIPRGNYFLVFREYYEDRGDLGYIISATVDYSSTQKAIPEGSSWFLNEDDMSQPYRIFGNFLKINNGDIVTLTHHNWEYGELWVENDTILTFDFTFNGKYAAIELIRFDWNGRPFANKVTAESIIITDSGGSFGNDENSFNKQWFEIYDNNFLSLNSNEPRKVTGTFTYRLSKGYYYLLFNASYNYESRFIPWNELYKNYLTVTAYYSPLPKSSPETGAENIYLAISVFFLSASFIIFKILKRRKM